LKIKIAYSLLAVSPMLMPFFFKYDNPAPLILSATYLFVGLYALWTS
jgi:hypothetical protein